MDTDTSSKNITAVILTELFRMVINLSKVLLQTQSFFIVLNQKQMILVLGGTGWRERKFLKFKRSQKRGNNRKGAVYI